MILLKQEDRLEAMKKEYWTKERRKEVTDEITNFASIFGKLYDLKKNCTAYIHLLMYHTEEILEKHGGLSLWSQEGLEAANAWHRMIFMRASNRNGGKYRTRASLQIMRAVSSI